MIRLNKTLAFSLLSLLLAGLLTSPAKAWVGMVSGDNPIPKLHVSGRFLQDPNGKNVNLHGYMQPGASWFNGEGKNYVNPDDYTDLAKTTPALNHYNKVADILSDPSPRYGRSQGWYCSYVRYISDGSSPENFAPGWDAEGNLAKPEQFEGWIRNVLVPYVQHCRERGLYVILVGNPSVKYALGNDGKPDHARNMSEQYQKNLITFWTAIASNPDIKSADNVQFEICNEPVAIESKFGANDWAFGNEVRWEALTRFMQPIVDTIRRTGADNIIWIPGLGWQGEYAGFAKFPVKGGNIGYAAHLYPAYGGTHDNATKALRLWASNYKPAADIAPMIITEMAWTPNKGQGYEGLWNASTAGFGTAFRTIFANQGNVGYQVGMVGDLFDNLKNGLDKSTLGSAQGTQAAFAWFPTYKDFAPTAPSGPAEGIYQIAPAQDTNLALQFAGSENSARLGQALWTGAINQKFRFYALGNNRYRLEPQNARGKYIDIANSNPNDDATVQLGSDSRSLSQQWIVIELEDGNYRFASALNPTQALDQPGGSLYATPAANQPNAALPAPPDPNLPAIPDPNATKNQMFGASANMQTFTWWGAPGQKWKLIPR